MSIKTVYVCDCCNKESKDLEAIFFEPPTLFNLKGTYSLSNRLQGDGKHICQLCRRENLDLPILQTVEKSGLPYEAVKADYYYSFLGSFFRLKK